MCVLLFQTHVNIEELHSVLGNRLILNVGCWIVDVGFEIFKC